ncbi:uncharacterized protein LOC123557879 [Mercenaria mercenaria]|uniref:uncharacterized protein LOC123557879 n=1 Tax=Mercenaria mercenaria TaxID=6596 RepID=UPI00234EAB81|nr:uncharacterized protein LOC123557879 [Mercenaria mercenaria]
MHWYKGDVQISRNSDIINQNVITIFDEHDEVNKYTVTIQEDLPSPTSNYSLEINSVSRNDAGVYTCKIELNGLSATANVDLSVKTTQALTGDKCYKSTISTCRALGFEKVTVPGPFGVSDIFDGNLLLQNIDKSDTFKNMTVDCKRSIMAMQCGLYQPKCQNGAPIPICREHCENDIILFAKTAHNLQESLNILAEYCDRWKLIVNTEKTKGIISGCPLTDIDQELHAKLQYGCKFLPYVTDSIGCVPISAGRGMRYMGSSGRILSAYYPDPYPLNSNCNWHVEVDPYHVIKFEIVDYDVGVNTGSEEDCGLYVEDKTNATVPYECGEVPSTFVTSGNIVKLKFVTDTYSTGRGFNIKYRQVPVDACISYPGEHNLTLSSDDNSSNLDVETCNITKIYLQDKRDTLVVRIDFLAEGCITLTGSLHLNVTLCNITTVHEYRTKEYVDIHFESSALVYNIATYKITYVRPVETVALDHSGRLQIMSEGEIGTMCGDLDQTAADSICKSLNYGWPAGIEQGLSIPETLPRLVSEIECTGEEEDISQCGFVFDPLGNDVCMESFYTRQTVTCPIRTIACDFTQSTCGYQLSHQVKLSPIYGLYKTDSKAFAKGSATSSTFSYSEGIYLHFEYIIRRGAAGDAISVNLLQTSSNTTVTLWKWASYTTYGTFKGCTAMPMPGSNKDELYQLVIEYTSGELDFIDPTAEYTGMKKFELSFEQCIDETEEIICSFEDLEACAKFIFLENLACPESQDVNASAIVTSKSKYSREEWIQSDYTYRNNTGHYVLVYEGSSMDVVDLTNIPRDLQYFRFYFGINNGVDVTKNATLVLYADDDVIFEAATLGDDWTEACIDISDTNVTRFSLQFGDQQFHETGNVGRKTALLAVDDIGFTSLPCSYYLNCDFQNDCSRRYRSVTKVNIPREWILEESMTDHTYRPHSDATFNTINKGTYMRADFADAEEGFTAVLQSGQMSEADDIKCVSFKFYINGNKNPGTLKVTVDTGREYETAEVSNGDKGNEWHMYKLSVTNKVRFIQFVAVRGIGDGTIAIDDVLFTTQPCSAGLDNLKYCTFEDPVLCGIDPVNKSWKQGRANDLSEYIQYDADLNKDGHFYYIIPSTLSVGEEISILFDVETNKTALQFSYIFASGGATKLYTEIDGQREYVNVQIVNYWVESECISLPVEFGGKLTLGIENDTSDVTFIAVDNVRLLNKDNCIEPSLTCDFTSGSTCSYNSLGTNWKFSNIFTSTQSGIIQAPVVLVANDTQHCFGFSYTVTSVDSVEAQPKLALYRDAVEIWSGYGHVGSTRNSGQVTVDGGVLSLQIFSEGRGLFEIYETRFQFGACVSITDCSEFICSDKCLPNNRKCDRVVDCFLGEDEEAELCGFHFNLDFTNVTSLSETGFQTPVTSNSAWRLLSDFTLNIDGSQVDIFDQLLVTHFTRLSPMPIIIESFEYHLEEDSCLQIVYYGDAASGKIQLRYQRDDQQQAEILFRIEPTPSTRHISVPVQSGNVRVLLYVYMIDLRPVYSDDIRSSAVFVIKQIIMHAGEMCSNLLVGKDIFLFQKGYFCTKIRSEFKLSCNSLSACRNNNTD